MRLPVWTIALAWVAGLGVLLGVPGAGPVALAQDDMGFDLSGEETKKKPPKKDPKSDPKKDPKKDSKAKDGKPAADDGGFGFEALDVSVKSAEKEAMETALDMMKDEKYETAATSLWELYNNPRA